MFSRPKTCLLFALAACGGARPEPARVEPVAIEPAQACERQRGLEHQLVDETIALTTALVRHQTVHAIAEPKDNAEFVAMATTLQRFADSNDLEFRVFGDHHAWEIIWPGTNRGAPLLRFVAHGDVVPVNDPPVVIDPDATPTGWTVAPFAALVRDGKLFGRGTEDDKGPIAAALVAMRRAKSSCATPSGDVVLAIGLGEEDDWTGMKAYAQAVTPATHTISIDSNFPVVVAQNGFVHWKLTFGGPAIRTHPQSRNALHIDSLNGGLFLTQVPDTASMTIHGRGSTVRMVETIKTAATRALTDWQSERTTPSPYSVEVTAEARAIKIVVHGRSAHSSTPEEGDNALWGLAVVAGALDLAPSPSTDALRFVRENLVDDHYGDRLQIAETDPVMGKMSVAPTLLNLNPEGVAMLEINLRRTGVRDEATYRALFEAKAAWLSQDYTTLQASELSYVGAPHLAATEGGLADILLDVYRDLKAAPEAVASTIRGGTYARLFPGAVDFGPSLPGERYAGHGADESISVETLEFTTRAYLETILRIVTGASNVAAQ